MFTTLFWLLPSRPSHAQSPALAVYEQKNLAVSQSARVQGNWKSEAILDLINLLIDLESQVKLQHTEKGWQASTVQGAFAVKGNFNQKIEFTGANVSWQGRTPLGKVALRGNFSEQAHFKGGHASWNAQTAVGSLAVKGNFAQADFIGGRVQLETNALVGSLKADLKIDGAANLSRANISWKANLFSDSTMVVQGKFDENMVFTGGSMKLGAKSALGILAIKANIDRNNEFSSGNILWQTNSEIRNITLDADWRRDGNYSTELTVKFLL
ncbi:MAG: hypothetical protein AAFQ80_24745 [Cyanobacteria bacterium J06621_8]